MDDPYQPITYFNTTVLYDQFYMELTSQGGSGKSPRLEYKDIEGIYRYIHNQAVNSLISAKVLDRYCRLNMGLTEALRTLVAYYRKRDDATNFDEMGIAELLTYDIIQENGGISLPEWAKLYPEVILTLPLYHISGRMAWDKSYEKIGRLRQSWKDMSITIPYSRLIKDAQDVTSYYDVDAKRNSIVFKLPNMFGNMTSLTISSNTDRMDDFITIMPHIEHHIPKVIFVGRDHSLEKESKLLFSIIYERRNPSDSAGT